MDSYLHLSDPAAFPGNFKYKDLSVKFPNLESNLAVDILLGNIIQGNIEIQIVGAWNNENTVGVVKNRLSSELTLMEVSGISLYQEL